MLWNVTCPSGKPIQVVKNYTSKACTGQGRILFGHDPQSRQSFQGLIDHLSLMFQSSKAVSFLIGDFYKWSQKAQETEDTYTDELQVLVRKIVA